MHLAEPYWTESSISQEKLFQTHIKNTHFHIFFSILTAFSFRTDTTINIRPIELTTPQPTCSSMF